jgi:hypothetical protein
MLKISSLKKLVTDSMAIDLGTASTIIAVKGRGVVPRGTRCDRQGTADRRRRC